VTLKLAVSADGKVGFAGRRPAVITGEAARDRVHRMRANNDAVLTGIGTALADDPLLTCRLPGMANRSPVRVALDSKLRLPSESRLAVTARDTPLWIIASDGASSQREEALRAKGAEVFRMPDSEDKLDLPAGLRLLAGRGITRLMVEAGPIVAAAFLQADLVDEAMLLRSPQILGAEAIDALENLPLETLTQSSRLVSAGTEQIGADTAEFYWRP
jgi:diaminohydroxyphosphoribosylaminopyrimidine deaminase/5-amino-6-(5-phosphoribosylamino)uracil reductase